MTAWEMRTGTIVNSWSDQKQDSLYYKKVDCRYTNLSTSEHFIKFPIYLQCIEELGKLNNKNNS